MKLLIVSGFLIVCASLSGAQTAHLKPARNGTQIAHVKSTQDVLPQTTLDFKPVGDGLPVSAQNAFIGYPVCDADGKFYFDAITLPRGERQVIVVSPNDKDAVSNYSMTSIMGLVNVSPSAMDVEGSDFYVLAEAVRSEDLLNNDVQPDSAEVRKYTKRFILHFHSDTSAPDIIPLDLLPFQPRQFAATSDGKFVILGLERTNQTPVLAVVNGSGELERYIDTYQNFGSDESIIANAPQQLKSQFQTMPQGAPLDVALLAAQFVHYRDSLLLLMPGSKPKVFTIRGSGSLESTLLHLPAGFEADSIIPSDNGWLIRASNGAANSKRLVVMADPSTGKALRIIHSPNFNASLIDCVHDGNYYGVHWPTGKEGDTKAFLMEAAP